jgi:hypothetical protein
VTERRHRLGFDLETPQEGGVVSQRRMEELERHPAFQTDVLGHIYVSRSAAADRAQETIAAAHNPAYQLRAAQHGHLTRLTTRDRAQVDPPR